MRRKRKKKNEVLLLYSEAGRSGPASAASVVSDFRTEIPGKPEDFAFSYRTSKARYHSTFLQPLWGVRDIVLALCSTYVIDKDGDPRAPDPTTDVTINAEEPRRSFLDCRMWLTARPAVTLVYIRSPRRMIFLGYSAQVLSPVAVGTETLGRPTLTC